MANRFPLIVDSSALQIKELPASDNLDLANSSIVNVVDITASGALTVDGNVSVGGTLTYEDVKNVDSVGLITARTGVEIGATGIAATLTAAGGAVFTGVVTATTFNGNLNASNLNSGTIPDARFPATLPAVSGANLTGILAGVGIQSGGTYIGSGATTINFVQSGLTATVPSAGVSTITIAAGGGGGGGSISTEAATPSNAVATLDLSAAQDHKVTATGICTITCTGGTEGESHTVRIINSGISTVGFSTYFLFPSGNSPSLPTASGAISLISFTVNRVGTAGTQLLSGASVNFS